MVPAKNWPPRTVRDKGYDTLPPRDTRRDGRRTGRVNHHTGGGAGTAATVPRRSGRRDASGRQSERQPQATALAEFMKRLQDYINLRAELGKRLKPLASTADSAELTARQDTLAAAIREARKGARPGDLIPTRVAGQIRNAVAADFRERNPDAKRAVFEEVPEGVRLVINRTMPDNRHWRRYRRCS